MAVNTMPGEQASQLVVLGTVLFYMFVAISMTLLNKFVLSSVPLPVFLLLCQTLISIVLLGIENKLGPLKTPRFDWRVAKELAPLALVNIVGLTFNNYCLQYVDASFHQIARGLVLPFTIIISIALLSQRPSSLSLVSALVVTSGFFAGVLLDTNHSSASRTSFSSSGTSYLGIAFGVLSSVLSACHAILIKKGLGSVQGSSVALCYYNNILSAIALVPMVFMAGEGRAAFTLMFNPDIADFLWGAGITGLFGFLISIVIFMSIKVTSPVTHMISSAARGVLQTVLAMYFFGDVMSRGRLVSICLIIGGSVLYVYSKTDLKPPASLAELRSLENGREKGKERSAHTLGIDGGLGLEEKQIRPN